jgi:ABC-type glycerol-3-phosphate transport system substrate-binding protein
MNKKAIGLLLALGMAASLAACGGGDTTTPATGESPAMSPGMSPAPSASPSTSP